MCRVAAVPNPSPGICKFDKKNKGFSERKNKDENGSCSLNLAAGGLRLSFVFLVFMLSFFFLFLFCPVVFFHSRRKNMYFSFIQISFHLEHVVDLDVEYMGIKKLYTLMVRYNFWDLNFNETENSLSFVLFCWSIIMAVAEASATDQQHSLTAGVLLPFQRGTIYPASQPTTQPNQPPSSHTLK